MSVFRPVSVGREILYLLVVPALLVVCSALGVIYSSFMTRQLVTEFQQLHEQRNAFQDEWGQLLLEQSTLGAFSRVEQLARKDLKMSVPSPEQTVMIDL
ncbi:Cell division protein [gamma proteobacterium HdN1]|nr:Cell division protein [gamma proteobacterium HdN1]